MGAKYLGAKIKARYNEVERKYGERFYKNGSEKYIPEFQDESKITYAKTPNKDYRSGAPYRHKNFTGGFLGNT